MISPSVEPFNEAKYKALMDGLECSEIRKTELERTLRIDSEFYSKEALVSTSLICKGNHASLISFVNVSDGNHAGISEKFVNEGIPYYRGQDAGTFFIENCNPICIDKDTFNLPVMRRSHLKKNDVLLSIVGTIGSLSLVYSDRDATCSCKLAILRPKEADAAEVLAVFLSSKYGQLQIKRFTRGAIQKGLILEDMDQLVLPCFKSKFRDKIRSMVIAAFNDQENAVKSYELAQSFVYEQLKFNSLATSQSSISEKAFSESFLETGRLDAEYYQPKYDAFLDILNRFETTSIPAEYHVTKNTGTNYADGISDVGVIKTKQLSNSGIDTESIESYFSAKTCDENKSTFIKTGDVVFASMGVGSLGKVSIFTYDGEKQFVTDSTLRIYRAKPTAKVRPEVLCVFLQSKLGQELIYRYVVGSTGIINIYDNDIARIPIPVFDDDTQEKIAVKVQESFALRRQSKKLLEYAKQAVEMAIEQGEDVAIAWLETITS